MGKFSSVVEGEAPVVLTIGHEYHRHSLGVVWNFLLGVPRVGWGGGRTEAAVHGTGC